MLLLRIKVRSLKSKAKEVKQMNSKDNKYVLLAEIFVKYFPHYIVDEFKAQARMGDTFIAERLFTPAWRAIKDELFRRQIPYTKNDVIVYFNSVLGMEPEVSAVWNEILSNDPEFLYLERMRIDQQSEKAYQATESETKKEDINRKASLKYLIRQTFLRTVQQSPNQMERVDWAFSEEFKIFLKLLTEKQIPTNAEELIKILHEEIPILRAPGAHYILYGINRYASTINDIKPRIIERTEFTVKIDPSKLSKELDAEWEEIEQEAEKPPVLTGYKFDVTTLEINPKGLKEAMEDIIFSCGPEEFFERIKIQHEKIKIFCRDHNLLNPLVAIVFKLKSGYERNYQKSLKLLSEKADNLNADKTRLEKKLKYIISALGIFWAFLEEAVRIEKTTNGNGKH